MGKRMRCGRKVIGGAVLSLALAGAVSMMGGTVAFADYDPKEAEEEEPVQVVTEETPESKPFSVAGNGEVLDNISDDETKQFITVRTKNNQTFFIVIDRANSVDNVYMLSMIDENDLAEFLEDGEEDEAVLPAVHLPQDNAVAVDENGNPISSEEEVNAGNEKKAGGSTGMLIAVVGFIAIFACGYYYFKIYKPKQKNGGSSSMSESNERQGYDADSEYDEEDFADDDDGGADEDEDDEDYSVESEDEETDSDTGDENIKSTELDGETAENAEMTAEDNTEDYYDEDDVAVEETPKRSTRRRRRRKKSEE